VHIEQRQNRGPFHRATTPSRYYRPANDYVAAFPTRLALARWTRGGDIPHVYSSTRNVPTMRAAWYAQAQSQFQAWLEKGGFHAE
jgi:hypothetical protein